MRIARILSLTMLILLAGCLPPRVINHPQPPLKVDYSPFDNGDCPPDEYGYFRICTPASPLYTVGCDRIDPAPDLFGGLRPAHPIAVCIYDPRNHPELADPWNIPENEYFFNIGGPLPTLVRYVIYVDGGFQLIRNADEFRSVFAPVESAEEALSTALALQNVYAEYGLKFNLKYRYEVKTLEDTYVEEVASGWLAHLFDYQFFGCGPHYYYAVDVQVTYDGQVEETARTKIYRDPSMDDLCQD